MNPRRFALTLIRDIASTLLSLPDPAPPEPKETLAQRLHRYSDLTDKNLSTLFNQVLDLNQRLTNLEHAAMGLDEPSTTEG